MNLSINVATNQDTLAASCWMLEHANNYIRGNYPPHYPVPSTIGHVSITGQDYKGVAYIDDANADDPVMVWMHDCWPIPEEPRWYGWEE